MNFLVDSMLPPQVADALNARGHDAVTPTALSAHNLPDDELVRIAAAARRVTVTENASDFASTMVCPVLLVRKAWWPQRSLAARLAAAVDRWAEANPEPGPWPHWLEVDLR